MKKLVIIGNGFDKAHGLKTTFDDFIKSSTIHAEKYSIFKNAGNEWCDVEDCFKNIVVEKLEEIGSEIDIDEIVEEIIDSYGIDEYGEVSYYGYKSEAFKEEIEAISKIVLLLIDFETNFLNYLRNLYDDSRILHQLYLMKTLKKLFDSTDRVINFNYTNRTAFRFYYAVGIDESSVHTNYPSSKASGRLKDVLIERMKYYEYDMENNLVEKEPIKRFFDDVVIKTQNNEEELYKWLKTKSKDFLKFRKKIIDELLNETFDEVHIIGHSLGKADWSVINAINSKNIFCYYHDKNDFDRKRAHICENKWNIKLKSDKEIFKTT